MKPTTGTEKKQEEDQTVVPIQTMVPAIPMESSQKCGPRFTTLLLGFVVLVAAGVVVWAVLTQRGSYYQPPSDFEESFLEPDEATRQNFDVRIDIDGEKCIESVHADERENIVTFHYTGENGREAGMAVYDFSQGLVALKDNNETVCFFTNAYYLPALDLGRLQLSARNKEVLQIRETVQLLIKGSIPHEFLETSGGPMFADLCRNVPSFWLAEITPEETNRMKRADSVGLDLTIVVPSGGDALLLVLKGPASGSAAYTITLG